MAAEREQRRIETAAEKYLTAADPDVLSCRLD